MWFGSEVTWRVSDVSKTAVWTRAKNRGKLRKKSTRPGEKKGAGVERTKRKTYVQRTQCDQFAGTAGARRNEGLTALQKHQLR